MTLALGESARAVHARLVEAIEASALPPGARLGAERQLALDHGVSRTTLREALDVLEAEGRVRRVRGRTGGVFVAERLVDRDLRTLAGLPTYLRSQGFDSGTRVLSTATLVADAPTAAALELAPGAAVLEIVRTRLADGEPISLERAVLPAWRFPGLLSRSLRGSLYALLEAEYGVAPAEATEQITVVAATMDAARALRIRRGSPLLAVQRTAREAAGVAFEHSHDLFRADRVRIVARARAGHDPAGALTGAVEAVSAG